MDDELSTHIADNMKYFVKNGEDLSCLASWVVDDFMMIMIIIMIYKLWDTIRYCR